MRCSGRRGYEVTRVINVFSQRKSLAFLLLRERGRERFLFLSSSPPNVYVLRKISIGKDENVVTQTLYVSANIIRDSVRSVDVPRVPSIT